MVCSTMKTTDAKVLTANPYDNIDISLIIPSVNFDLFKHLYNSIIRTCSNFDNVEMLLKLDDISDYDEFYNLCVGSQFKFKIITYPKYNSRYSLHHFFNDLGSISSGKMLWMLNDDATIISGDWYTSLINTRNTFKDNIHCVIVPFDKDERKREIIPTPAITREWYDFFGFVTGLPNYDRWICEIAKSINRRVILNSSDLLVTMPKGHRVLSKKGRKEIFYPRLEKAIKKFNKRRR